MLNTMMENENKLFASISIPFQAFTTHEKAYQQLNLN